MRNDLEQGIAKHGLPLVVALMGALLGKLYSREKETWLTFGRSMLAAAMGSFLLVEQFNGKMEYSMIFVYVFVVAFLSDVIMQSLNMLGAKLKEDPTLLTKIFPWSKRP